MTNPLDDLKARPIPDLAQARAAKANYREFPIIANYDKPLVEARSVGLIGRNHYAHSANPPYWRAIDGAIDALWMRAEVAQQLQTVNMRLRPHGLRLHLFDAWRPRAVQRYFYHVWMPEQLRARRPELSGDALLAEVSRYWSAPSQDAASPAPHETGAAVDLTLALESGEHLHMGSVFDDATALANTDRFEGDAPPEMSFSFEEARANRRLLYWLMTEAGFASHPDEWWHYSYGDQLWAALTGAPHALYGLAEPPPS